jgi:glucosyl-dolichyl phosphate glucuronosyltransferase
LAVQSVLAQHTDGPYEVIVVDNNSTDGTRERIQQVCRQSPKELRYLFERRQGASAARNTGIAAARGNIVAFIDDDVVVQRGWLSALAEAYRAHPDAWCVGGKIVLAFPEVLPRWFDRRSELLSSHLGRLDLGDATIERPYPDDVFGGNFSVRRDILDRVGLFDIALGPVGTWRIEAEESDLCWRIQKSGGAVYYCGAAVVAHAVPNERLTKKYFRSRAYWGGKTWALVERKDIFGLYSGDLPRAAARIVRNMLRSSISPRRADRCADFEDELRFWRSLGYRHQALLARLGRSSQDRGRASLLPSTDGSVRVSGRGATDRPKSPSSRAQGL